MTETVYITGHKNPDTDSVCSAIAYAELKKRLGVAAIPVRIGNLNRETEFVLDYFGVEAPDYLDTVRTQVADLNIDLVGPVTADISIKTAWSIMQKLNIKVLPVADEEGRLVGIIALSDITGCYMDTFESNVFAASDTPLRNITETLNAKLLTGGDEDLRFAGKVVIAAMSPESMDPFIEKGDIVITGDRTDAQLKALESGASCLILTCGGSIDDRVLALAQKNGTVLMETRYDTFITARLINQSIPIGYVMTKDDLVYFNLNDFTDTIKDRMLQTRYRSYPVVDNDNIVKGFISRFHLISQNRKKIILLDHNEKIQTIDGIEQADILEIIDHHRIGDIQTGNPIYFKNDAVGSTATLIANMYFENGITPPKRIAGILCAAVVSDTMKFKSPTNTYLDETTASKLAAIADINIDEFAAAMFDAGSTLEGMSPKEILYYDFKDYNLNKLKVGIGQKNLSDARGFEKLKMSLVEQMREVQEKNRYNLLLLLLTDIKKEGSYVIFVGNIPALTAKLFDTEEQSGSVFLKGVVSRKKQVVPLITEAIQSL